MFSLNLFDDLEVTFAKKHEIGRLRPHRIISTFRQLSVQQVERKSKFFLSYPTEYAQRFWHLSRVYPRRKRLVSLG